MPSNVPICELSKDLLADVPWSLLTGRLDPRTFMVPRGLMESAGSFDTSFEHLFEYDLGIRLTARYQLVGDPLPLLRRGSERKLPSSQREAASEFHRLWRSVVDGVDETAGLEDSKQALRRRLGRAYAISREMSLDSAEQYVVETAVKHSVAEPVTVIRFHDGRTSAPAETSQLGIAGETILDRFGSVPDGDLEAALEAVNSPWVVFADQNTDVHSPTLVGQILTAVSGELDICLAGADPIFISDANEHSLIPGTLFRTSALSSLGPLLRSGEPHFWNALGNSSRIGALPGWPANSVNTSLIPRSNAMARQSERSPNLDLSWLRIPELMPLLSEADHLGAASDWSWHVPFLYWASLALEPRTIVHVGPARAVVYAALCQAVKVLGNGARCFSVSPLERADEDPAEIAFERHHAGRYGEFSTLFRGEHQEVFPQIGNAIDLLVLDAEHSYEKPVELYRTWSSTISDRGVVVIKGIGGNERAKLDELWNELAMASPHIELTAGGGLGVAAVSPNVPVAAQELLIRSVTQKEWLSSIFQLLGAMWTRTHKLQEELNRTRDLLDWLKIEFTQQISDARWEAVEAREQAVSEQLTRVEATAQSLSTLQSVNFATSFANEVQTELLRRGKAAHNLGLHLPRTTMFDLVIGTIAADTPTEVLDNFLLTADASLIRASPLGSGHIYIVDGAQAAVQKKYEGRTHLTIVTSHQSGFAEAHNYMMKKAFSAGGEIYILAASHLAFHPDTVLAMVRMVRAAGGLAVIQAHGPFDSYGKSIDPVTFDVPSASEHCVAVGRQLYDAIGGFTEGRARPADVLFDYSKLALAKGFAVKLCPHAVVIPTDPVSFGKKPIIAPDEKVSIA
jgi:hypothetical protein